MSGHFEITQILAVVIGLEKAVKTAFFYCLSYLIQLTLEGIIKTIVF
ncbi:hypothetical protein ASZ90_019706 [hydrocarbon metagenome]|uniref:Uncharacterized protein n=1 Tax=hydrocarbon metagenome TaxID=938273 RepID=A0A0W8E2N8_9ZZZZ